MCVIRVYQIFILMRKTVIILLTFLASTFCSEARQPREGYRGFFEWNNSMRSELFGYFGSHGNLYMYRENCYYTGFSTSHGYQINPNVFVGAGLDLEYSPNYDGWIIPIFLDGRYDMEFGKFTPYADVRLGANFAEGIGVYFSPTVGYRFNWGRKVGLNVGAGLTLAGYTVEHFEGSSVEEGGYEFIYTGRQHRVRPYFSFRVGIDF